MKIFHAVDPKYHKNIKKNAKKTGLDQIGDEYFELYKVGSKDNPEMITEERKGRGFVSIIGTDKYVWILIENHKDWWKTSPVLSCLEVDDGIFDIETENSLYRLNRT